MAEKEWGLVQSFYIDNGELDGQTPQQCFVLGYEFANVLQAVESGRRFEMTVRCENRNRIEEALATRRRRFTWQWMNDDKSEEWIYLMVPEANESEAK